MSSKRADSAHLLRGSRNTTKVWFWLRAAESRTGCVDEATCSGCLRLARDHYVVRHDESWQQIRRIVDRQEAILAGVEC